jgi:choline dehydrogenase
MAPTYGLAEQAADMIKAQYASGSTSGNSNSGSNSGSNGSNGNQHNAAGLRFSTPFSTLSTLLFSGLVMTFML